MKDKKLVIISRSFAPLVIGSPILLANLFSSYPGRLEAIAGWQYGAKIDPEFKPPCPTTYLRMPGSLPQRAFDRYTQELIPFIRLFIIRQLKKMKPDAVLGTCPSGEFFIAGYQACKKLGIPFMAHMHDLWEENVPVTSHKKEMAIKWEREILMNAERVYCMTDVQKQFYHDKYGINPRLLPHTIRAEELNNKSVFDGAKIKRKTKKIVYTGNVSNGMNLDAVQQFVKAVDHLPKEYEIKMFVSWDKELCQKFNIYHERIIYDWLPMSEVQKEMQEANLLFLPLSHKNASMDEVHTVFATKTLDYLVSGSPILAFSPPDSFHSISAKKNGWAYVTDKDDPLAIVEGILKVTNDEILSSQLVEKAFDEAMSRNPEKYATELYSQLP
ncbi:MAG: hypothetical protein DHS20C18_24660 [Saprospiraceae bacterium]|nr:MAG: hypothetical protein DHS20C18_24660 [Saprospiraceae bacterium]